MQAEHCNRQRICFALTTVLLFLTSCAMAQQTVLTNNFFHVEVSSKGNYQVIVSRYGWTFQGNLDTSTNNIQRHSGTDKLGAYQELRFSYDRDGLRQGSIRIYDHRPVLQFGMTMLTSGQNLGAFPDFSVQPNNLYHLGFQPKPFGTYRFGYLGPQGPWVFFDGNAHALVISPADHFFVSDMQADTSGFASGITQKVAKLPAGFTHATLFVVAMGVNEGFATWGQAMQRLANRTPPTDNADVLLRKLSYWTDRGAAYFYRFEPQMGYAGTLAAVEKKFVQFDLPLGSMQIDSWFYPKGRNADWHRTKWVNGAGGIYLYEADKDLFPKGLRAFSHEVGLPLITHSRWIDQSSPYRTQYKMSGNVIIDPRYWRKTAAWLHAAGVVTYEQDWLRSYAQAEVNLTDPEAFHDMMAHAMQREGLTMQYCMPAPADYMQGAHYNNLTTIRTSRDRFGRARWDEFLYDSRMARALGIWPWVDVFRSGEQANLVLATLSAGPVGVGDSLSELDTQDLLHAVRSDGVIVKPDVTIRPLDRMYVADASGAQQPMIASSWTTFGKTRITYVFTYARKGADPTAFQAADFGLTGPVYIYNWRTGGGVKLDAQDVYNLPLQGGWGYAIVTPVGPSGMALVGDTEQIATAGRRRIGRFSDDGRLHISIRFAAGEKAQTISVYAPHEPHTSMVAGRLEKESYETTAKLLQLTVAPNRENDAVLTVDAGKPSQIK